MDSRVALGTHGHVGDRATNASTGGVAVDDRGEGIVLADSSGNGIPDAVAEANPALPQSAFRDSEAPGIDIDPRLADTDGDGLTDREEIDVQYRVFEENGETKLEARVTNALADPALYDTDGEGVSDGDEVDVWGTNPWLTDTSSDGFNDLVDPEPLKETGPPEATVRSEDWTDYFLIGVDGDRVESIEAEAYFDPRSPLTDAYWSDADADVTALGEQPTDSSLADSYPITDGDTALVELGRHGVFDEDPRKVRFTVRGEHVDSYFVVDVSDGDPRIVEGTLSLAGLTLAVPADGQVAAAALVTLAAIFLVADVAIEYGATLVAGSEVEQTALGTGTLLDDQVVDSWSLPETNTDITLPAGALHDTPTAGAQDRGFGWKYIDATTSLTQADLEHVIENPTDVIEQDGEVRYVIGDATDGIEKVILGIIGGTVMAASTGMERNADCEDWVQWDNDRTEEGNPEHTLGIDRDKDKWLDSVEQIKNIIKDPRMIFDAGGKRHYVGKANGKWVALVLEGSDVVWELVTALDKDGGAYDSLDDLLKSIRKGEKDIVYDPVDGIDDC